MILGLDVSTSCTGYSILSPEGSLIDLGYIRLDNLNDVFEKAQRVSDTVKSIGDEYDIQGVFIEQDLQSFRSGFSSARTLSTLSRFNGIVSYICYTVLGVKPVLINVSIARRKVGISIKRKKDGGKPTKEQVFDWVSLDLEKFKHVWPTKILKSGPRKGKTVYEKGCYDMADAYVISKAGHLLNS